MLQVAGEPVDVQRLSRRTSRKGTNQTTGTVERSTVRSPGTRGRLITGPVIGLFFHQSCDQRSKAAKARSDLMDKLGMFLFLSAIGLIGRGVVAVRRWRRRAIDLYDKYKMN